MTDYLDEIQARADAASPAPWSCLMSDSTVVNPTAWWMTYPDPDTDASGRFDWPQIVADAAFIDNARTDVPRLVAEQRDLIRLLDAAREDKTKARRQRSEYRLRAMRAEATLRAVEALHSPVEFGGRLWCAHCDDRDGSVEYPCRTVEAIRDALEAR